MSSTTILTDGSVVCDDCGRGRALSGLERELAAALRALVERDGLFLDGPGIVECVYCPAASERHGDPVPHAADCPIAQARRVLAELGE